jgi:hypothetical protein
MPSRFRRSEHTRCYLPILPILSIMFSFCASPAAAAAAAAPAAAAGVGAHASGIPVSPSVFCLSPLPVTAPSYAAGLGLDEHPTVVITPPWVNTPSLSSDSCADTIVRPMDCADIVIPSESLAEVVGDKYVPTRYADKTFMLGDDDVKVKSPFIDAPVATAAGAADTPAATAAGAADAPAAPVAVMVVEAKTEKAVLKSDTQALIRHECELAMPTLSVASQQFIRETWQQHTERTRMGWAGLQSRWARNPMHVAAVAPAGEATEIVRAELCATIIRSVTDYAGSVKGSVLASAHTEFLGTTMRQALAKPGARLGAFIDTAVTAVLAVLHDAGPFAEHNASLQVMGACFSTLAVLVAMVDSINRA